ncbi:hypothetical protein C1X61_07785 [Pseudomonas sp. FW215-T2]|nr:hypothetical protein C1X61_07785 [Pseudomonas sp. FW215-T2]PNA12105.1 hypothetical protein C1X62_13850 [Pseudomonas sp. FW215-R3]PNB37927.1 hypothetical protein C1X63_10885 [Pseudomonas sp. FW305-131]
MVVKDNAARLTPRGALRFIASKLAPTGVGCVVSYWRGDRRGQISRCGLSPTDRYPTNPR